MRTFPILFFICLFLNLIYANNNILQNKDDPYFNKVYNELKPADYINVIEKIDNLNSSNFAGIVHNDIYIYPPSVLDENSFPELKNKFVKELNNSNYNNVILDLRDNVGGTAMFFFDLNVLLSKNKETDFYGNLINLNNESKFAGHENMLINKNFQKMYIFINKNTASGYEWLISSLKEHKANNITIIGEPSRGKIFAQVKDDNTTYTSSIITNANNIPIFQIFPDYYYFNDFNLTINDIKNIIDNLKIDNLKDIDKNISIINKKNNINRTKYNYNYKCDINMSKINTIYDIRNIFFKNYTEYSLKTYNKIHKNKRCESEVECELLKKENIKDIENIKSIWKQYFSNILCFNTIKDLTEQEIEYFKDNVLEEMYLINYINIKGVTDLYKENNNDKFKKLLNNFFNDIQKSEL